ncbi:MAG TPA: UDP-N-acetylmuramate dehydrogenase [Terriglobia bacterium]|nr:UDP-N-acetylmuramate dehydrogenase [Terriglobia bacterium]
MRLDIQEHVPLAPLTTFGVGGPARYFTSAGAAADVIDALDFAATRSLPVFVLGGGSNIVLADRGFPGLVLKVATAGLSIESSDGHAILRAGAGEEWDRVVSLAVERNLAGIECLSGIPGSAGGTPVQNVGAYGQEISETLVSVEVLDRETQTVRDLPRAECGFSYRTSIFNSTLPDRYIVLAVRYALTPAGPAATRYPEIGRRFEGLDHPPTLAEVRSVVREARASKGMLLTPGDADCRSAGSFFKNPVVDEDTFKALEAAASKTPPRYPAPAGKVKTSAAWLIEQAGFPKGFSRGAAAISRKHTLAIINPGNATASDIVALAREIRSKVEDRFGVKLAPEPTFVGFDEPF